MKVLISVLLFTVTLMAAPYKGVVKIGGVGVPGAAVTATQGDKKLTAVTDLDGGFSFPDLADGTWTMQVEMTGFAPLSKDVTISGTVLPSDVQVVEWNLQLLPYTGPAALASPPPASTTANAKPSNKPAAIPPPAQPASQRTNLNASANAPPPAPADTSVPNAVTQFGGGDSSANSLAINGSINNGAASAFAQSPAFGNNRRNIRSPYNGAVSLVFDNSVLDAKPFSFTGQDTPRQPYNQMTANLVFGGPLQIPHVFNVRTAPNFNVSYYRVSNRNDALADGLMPTQAERGGDFTSIATPIINPATAQPFQGNMIPSGSISSQAKALLAFYPLPNLNDPNVPYNYQVPADSINHTDNLRVSVNKAVNRTNFLSGQYQMSDSRTGTTNLSGFGFLDTNDSLGQQVQLSWRHNFTQRLSGTATYNFARRAITVTPFFDNQTNVSGAAGINGNNQQPQNWGPPALVFATSGFAGLSDLPASHSRNQSSAVGYSLTWSHSGHNWTFGGDWRRLENNQLSQQNPRGMFTFNGDATNNGSPAIGNDFADFLLGIPDTSAIAFGNADKYFRQSLYDGFATDDYRVNSSVTMNAGVRWDYATPVTELYNRLVNLDVAPGFTGATPVLASSPVGPLTSQTYPNSLVRPDKLALQPKIGLAWRPFPASSLVIHAGYSVSYNTGIYQQVASQMSQEAPLSTSLQIANSAANPLTLANGFVAPPNKLLNTFAVDPNFRMGYVQNWTLWFQRDLPAALVLNVNYSGNKGTRAMQLFAPNTYPVGATNPCPACPSGYEYLTSNGNSTREAGSVQLLRRFHNGFSATATYTYAHAIDDAILGNSVSTSQLAQNWLNLDGERGNSSFDQRQVLSITTTNTTGVGVKGGGLLTGWRGTAYKGWTLTTTLNLATGLPLTPVVPGESVPGTGFSVVVRPNTTSISPYSSLPAGHVLNPAAFVIPPSGQWGDAGRDSLTGPGQFGLNASLQRVFTLNDRLNLTTRFDATNVLNKVQFPSWNTSFGTPQFGEVLNSTNPLRSLQGTLRLQF